MKEIYKYLNINNYINFLKKKILKIKSIFNYFFCFNKIIEESFIELEISNMCNALCIFCPWITIRKTNKKFGVMSFETYEKVLEKIAMQKYKIISFTPTTGELLMNKDWDKYIEKAFILKNIEKIIFYSNGILLNEENRKKLLKLLNLKNNKLKEIHFSIGGIDAETYNLMYGVNRFEKVSENIILLLKELKNLNKKVNVLIEIRLPKDSKIKKEDINNYFNFINYRYLTIRILRDFIPINCIPKRKELNYVSNKLIKNKPCRHLYKTRYDANGGIWADGCVISEMPNDIGLKLGNINDSLEKIENRRNEIVKKWRDGKLPEVCKECQFYTWY